MVLAAVIFDYQEKILVTPEGFLPHKKITDAWVERVRRLTGLCGTN